jgi:RNA polymerase sigma-70 factor (ECF subfamily)
MTMITRRRAIDRVRAISSARRVEASHTAPATSVDTDHQTAVADAVSAANTIGPALLVLTRREREVVLLTYWHDRTAAQSAQLLNIPVSTLKSRLHAAVTPLRRLLDAELP